MKVPLIAGVVIGLSLAVAPEGWAQGGGASSTGTIQGRVVDTQGAVLPGVTVTATSPAALGVADGGHVGDRQLPVSGDPAWRLFRHLRTPRLQHRAP